MGGILSSIFLSLMGIGSSFQSISEILIEIGSAFLSIFFALIEICSVFLSIFFVLMEYLLYKLMKSAESCSFRFLGVLGWVGILFCGLGLGPWGFFCGEEAGAP